MSLKHWQDLAANAPRTALSKDISKPVVHFIGEPSFWKSGDCVRASVNVLDHPVWGEDIVNTSIIIGIEDNGNFETLNTRYVSVDVANAHTYTDMLLSA